MEIGPLKDGTTVHEGSLKSAESKEKPSGDNRLGDSVSLSNGTTGRLDNLADETTTDKIMHDGDRDISRLDEIRDRIDSGFYDQQVVKEKMVEKLLDEMLENINKFYR